MSAPNQITPEQAEAAIANLRREVEAQALQELAQALGSQCYKKCAKPTKGNRLDKSEQSCLAQCIDRYMDTMGIVNKAMVDRQDQRR